MGLAARRLRHLLDGGAVPHDAAEAERADHAGTLRPPVGARGHLRAGPMAEREGLHPVQGGFHDRECADRRRIGHSRLTNPP